MKKVLIIHPKDKSTDFLCPIYEGIENKTVITGNVSKYTVRELIKIHDQVMMMGHGYPGGLFSVGQFNQSLGVIIDESMVDLLKEKENNVFIWCNADKFVERHNLKGLYSGMFISEVSEANYCGLFQTKQDEVTTSNDYFAYLLGKMLPNFDLKTTHSLLKEEYGVLAESSAVAKYNHNRLYLL